MRAAHFCRCAFSHFAFSPASTYEDWRQKAEAAKRSRSRRGVGRLDRFTSGHLHMSTGGHPKGGQRALASVPVSEAEVTSIRQAAAACNVTPPVVRRWLFLGLITQPPWTLQQVHQVRDETDPQGRRRGPQVAHGTLTRWLEGCDCDRCREAQNDASRARRRVLAQKRLPVELRQKLLDAICAGQPFRVVLRDLGLTSNQV
jgi:hypothetical protein